MAALTAFLGLFPAAGALLGLDQTRVGSGEYWLAFTSQLVHWDIQHLTANMAGALLLATLFTGRSERFWVVSGTGAWLAVAAGLYLEPHWSTAVALMPANPDQYRGLSGVLYGWLAAGLLTVRRGTTRALPWLPDRQPIGRTIGRAAVALLVLWTLVDMISLNRELLAHGSSGPEVPRVQASVHLYGILGAVAGLPFIRRRRRSLSGRSHAGSG